MVQNPTPPNDLATARGLLCMIPNGILSDLCMSLLLFIQYKKSEIQISRIHQLLQAEGISVTLPEVQKIANAICYHFRCAVTSNMSTEEFLTSLRSFRLYPDDKLNVIAEVWKLEGKFILETELKEHLSIGELLSMDWKLSMAVSSSSCKSLNSPMVTMLTRVLNPNGEIISRAFELTLDQFQQFSNQLEQTKEVLETV